MAAPVAAMPSCPIVDLTPPTLNGSNNWRQVLYMIAYSFGALPDCWALLLIALVGAEDPHWVEKYASALQPKYAVSTSRKGRPDPGWLCVDLWWQQKTRRIDAARSKAVADGGSLVPVPAVGLQSTAARGC